MGDSDQDLYGLLGVLPGAEDIVVTAAYRALAQRYHPDKWRGDPAEAHRRMAELNGAYEILSDQVRRAAYDHQRRARSEAGFEASDAHSDEFSAALAETEGRWQVACDVYPDLQALRFNLNRISIALAFGYVSTLLTTRGFDKRLKLAADMERSFLERYFSSNQEVVSYAKKLILAGQREAAKALNELVDVVGTDGSSKRLIELVDQRFNLKTVWSRLEAEEQKNQQRIQLVNNLIHFSDFASARDLAQHLGFSVTELGRGLFKYTAVSVKRSPTENLEFEDRQQFVAWAKQSLCMV